jgi:hypothetical protein
VSSGFQTVGKTRDRVRNARWAKKSVSLFSTRNGALVYTRTVSSELLATCKTWGCLKNARWVEKAWVFCPQETGSLLAAHGEQRASDREQDPGSLEKLTLSGKSVSLLFARNGVVWFIRAQWAAGSVKLLVTGKTWGRLRVHVERQEVKTFSVSARNGVVHSAQWAAKSVKAFRRGQDPGSLKTHGEQREVFHFSKVATCRGRLVFCSCSFFCVGCVVEKWAVYGVRRRRQWPKEEGSWTGGERAWPAPMERETATTR